MRIDHYKSGELESNGYIIYQRDGGDAYIIDPGEGPEKFIDHIKRHDLRIKAILLTHHHPDHVGAVGGIVSEFACPVYIHEADMKPYGRPAEPLHDGDAIDLEGEKIEVINTPGHTRGGVCFYAEQSNVCFTGDTIFADEVGRSDLWDSDRMGLAVSIAEIIDKWPEDLVVYPGHGPSATMKHVKETNIDYIQAMERYRCR